jgi:hypothetical protein
MIHTRDPLVADIEKDVAPAGTVAPVVDQPERGKWTE